MAKGKSYKFHAEYLKPTAEDKVTPKAKPPDENDDWFWSKKFKIVNHRRKFPQDFNEAEFKMYYGWVSNGQNDKLSGEDVLFPRKGSVPIVPPPRRHTGTPPPDPRPRRNSLPVAKEEPKKVAPKEKRPKAKEEIPPEPTPVGKQRKGNLFNHFSFKR